MSTNAKIGMIIDSLDLGFSDHYKNENVRQLTFQKKLDIMEHAIEFVTIEESINFSIFSTKGSRHPTAEIYAIDFPSDLRASIYLLLGGYYRQAILCLRNWLEIRLTGIYFGLVDQDRSQYEKWKRGKKRAPIGKMLIKRLFSRAEFHRMDKQVELRERLNRLHEELSAFTHAAILEQYDLQSETDNVPRFNPQSVDLWFEFALRVFRELVFCSFLAYGRDAFKSVGKSQYKTLKRYLPAMYLHRLQDSKIL